MFIGVVYDEMNLCFAILPFCFLNFDSLGLGPELETEQAS
jgi:hypothetical protein